MIGAKTLVTVTLLLGELAVALALGLLWPARLATRGWDTLFVVGCFGVVVGTLMFRFWQLGEASRHYFRWSSEATPWERSEGHFLGSDRRRVTLGENRGDAFDLPPAAQHALCVAIALLLALACIDARSVELLGRFERSRGNSGAGYCPDPDADKPALVDPNAPGCELIRRAYALGYAKSLGDCAPKQAALAPRAACTRRQRDEPLFHYAWRLLDGFWGKFRAHTGSAYFGDLGRDFRARVGHLASLRSAERQVLASAPHAAHHIWTNLPDPADQSFRARDCADRYRSLGHQPAPAAGDKGKSQVFEHVMAQLLFESRYEPAAGYCREYHVHWNAPPDACQRLAARPEAFLAQSGARDSVEAVLDRHRIERELATLHAQPPPLDPSAVISFSCYVDGQPAARTSTPFSFAGQRFTVEEVHVPAATGAALYVDRYDAVAQLLVKGFHYGRLLSAAGIEPGASPALQGSFSGHDFLLTRLYGLESVDLYLDPGWIAGRPDLLEVYPYQRHLKNYVQTFRRQYQRERGRL